MHVKILKGTNFIKCVSPHARTQWQKIGRTSQNAAKKVQSWCLLSLVLLWVSGVRSRERPDIKAFQKPWVILNRRVMKLPVLNSVYQPTSSHRMHGLRLSRMGSKVFCPACRYAVVRLLQARGDAKTCKKFSDYSKFSF